MQRLRLQCFSLNLVLHIFYYLVALRYRLVLIETKYLVIELEKQLVEAFLPTYNFSFMFSFELRSHLLNGSSSLL